MIPGHPAHECNSRNGVVTPNGNRLRSAHHHGTALAAAAHHGHAGPANASDDCTPSNGTPAATGEWARDSFTDWSANDATPADPDNETGEDNLANLTQIGEG